MNIVVLSWAAASPLVLPGIFVATVVVFLGHKKSAFLS